MRNVLGNPEPSPDDGVGSDSGELVNRNHSADDGVILNLHVTCYIDRVSQDNIVSDYAVVSYVSIHHYETIRANSDFPPMFGSAIYCSIFPDYRILPDFQKSFLSAKFQILRRGP